MAIAIHIKRLSEIATTDLKGFKFQSMHRASQIFELLEEIFSTPIKAASEPVRSECRDFVLVY